MRRALGYDDRRLGEVGNKSLQRRPGRDGPGVRRLAGQATARGDGRGRSQSGGRVGGDRWWACGRGMMVVVLVASGGVWEGGPRWVRAQKYGSRAWAWAGFGLTSRQSDGSSGRWPDASR